MKLQYDIKLNIKSIILYEKLTGSPFSEFKNNEEQVAALLYCMLVANNDYHYSFQDTIEILFTDESFIKDISQKLEKQLLCQQQFIRIDEKEISEKALEENTEKTFIYKLIPILVKDCNLDINYVLYDMNYADIQDYIKHKEDSDKVDLVEKRLFTYLSMLPHINSKKVKSPSDILPFEWEIEEKKEKAKSEIERNKHKLKQFLESSKEIKLNNNTEKTQIQ